MARPLPETVLFDLDGTLVDNFEAIHRCYDDVMSMMGLPGVTLEQIRRAVGERLDRELVPDRDVAPGRDLEGLVLVHDPAVEAGTGLQAFHHHHAHAVALIMDDEVDRHRHRGMPQQHQDSAGLQTSFLERDCGHPSVFPHPG